MPLEILYDEGGWLVVNKPAGLASTGRDLEDPNCVQFQLQAQLGRRVWAVHQLDRGTTGALLFARKRSLVAEGQKALKGGRKAYLALVHGVPDADRFVIDAPLRYVKRKGRPAVAEDGLAARTDVRVRERTSAHAWIEATLRSGRTHQIRVHLAHVGHPLVGDGLHGECTLLPFPALHAFQLRFLGVVVEAAVPEALARFRQQLA
ncbi:MAG: RNA pseudouridine synthase [Myxococcota bacterium]